MLSQMVRNTDRRVRGQAVDGDARNGDLDRGAGGRTNLHIIGELRHTARTPVLAVVPKVVVAAACPTHGR